MQGFPEESFTGRPVIGILNSWSEVAGCNAHLRDLAEHVKRGVLRAGGFPVEIPVISLGEPIIKPTAMLYRNLMAMAVEELIRGNPLDGVVLLASCDKTIPASLMGAASVDVPALMVTGGPMLSGRFRNEHVGACTDCWRLHDELRADRIDAGRLGRVRGRDVPQRRALLADGDRIDDGLPDRGARHGAQRAARRSRPWTAAGGTWRSGPVPRSSTSSRPGRARRTS